MAEATKRYAVVTGASKGIGLETVRQLASNGINVVLTARDEKRGLETVEKLKDSAGFIGDQVVFHQLDVTNPASVGSLAEFIKKQFGKLDILVNNAGVSGARIVDADSFHAAVLSISPKSGKIDWRSSTAETYESTEECLQINYCGAKRTAEALIPLLQLSDSPRIVNVAAAMGKLKYLPNEWAQEVFSDAENLTEERIDEVLTEFLKDFKEGSLESKNWPLTFSGYQLSKAALIAYTRILAKKNPNFRINALCPGYVKTDINSNKGVLPVEEGAACVVKLALLPKDGPTGLFFDRFEPYSD